MADFNLYKPFLWSWEGGFVNNPNDPGGATMRGVTRSTYEQYCARRGKPCNGVQSLRTITPQEWADIMRGYWDAISGDELRDQSVANMLADFYICSGEKALMVMRSLLGYPAREAFDAKRFTKMINRCPGRPLFELLKSARIEYLLSICTLRPKLRTFRRGWTRRINAMTYGSYRLNA